MINCGMHTCLTVCDRAAVFLVCTSYHNRGLVPGQPKRPLKNRQVLQVQQYTPAHTSTVQKNLSMSSESDKSSFNPINLLYCKVIQPTADTYATRRQARFSRPANTLMLCFLTAHLAAASNNPQQPLNKTVMNIELNMPSKTPAATYPSIRFELKFSDTFDSENSVSILLRISLVEGSSAVQFKSLSE